MPEYRVEWSIDIPADNPEAAARAARDIQLDPDCDATVFDVWDDRIAHRVDLSPYAETPGDEPSDETVPETPPPPAGATIATGDGVVIAVQRHVDIDEPSLAARERTDRWSWDTNEICDLLQNDEGALRAIEFAPSAAAIRDLVVDFMTVTPPGGVWNQVSLNEIDFEELEWFFANEEETP